MDKMLLVAKAATAVAWLWAIGGSLGMEVPFARFAPLFAVTLFVTHCLEVPLLGSRLRDHGPLRSHVLGILMFGVLYYLSRRTELVPERSA